MADIRIVFIGGRAIKVAGELDEVVSALEVGRGELAAIERISGAGKVYVNPTSVMYVFDHSTAGEADLVL